MDFYETTGDNQAASGKAYRIYYTAQTFCVKALAEQQHWESDGVRAV